MSEPEPSVLRMLGVEVPKLKERIEALEDRLEGSPNEGDDIAELRRAVEDLAVSLAALAEEVAEDAGSRPLRAPWWPLLTGAEREQAWGDLVGWIEEVIRTRHPEQYPKLGRCWFRHADVVDELSALRVAWHAAYRTKSPLATAPIEWLDRWLPSAMGRVAKAMNSCKAGHEDSGGRQLVDARDLQAFIAGDVAAHLDPPAPDS